MKSSVVSRFSAVAAKFFGCPAERTTDKEQRSAKMYEPVKVRLFIKPYCGWCAQAMDWLDDNQIEYETLDVIADGKAYDEMYRLSGQTLAPVIDVDGKILADFGARDLEAFWKKLERDV